MQTNALKTSAIQTHVSQETSLATILRAVAEFSCHEEVFQSLKSIPIMKNIVRLVNEGRRLRFILPAFPAKSPNPQKTSGIHPDLGEVLGLNRLNAMCKKISAVYTPGAEVVICSDGRVFGDVVMVPDEDIDTYSAGIHEIITEFGLTHLSTFSMDHFFPELSAPDLRERLIAQYARSTEEIRHLVIRDESYKMLFNGVHRFMLEDQMVLLAKENMSKNQISKKTKARTYELLRRSDAWSTLLLDCFPDALRLSIHAYPLSEPKFGIRLAHATEKWATPWHNVAVRKGDEYVLMHMKDALKLGATKAVYRGKYVYFKA